MGKRYGNIYLLNVNFDDVQCLMSIKDECDLWHKKLGHINAKQISKISSKALVCGLPKINFNKSDSCNACTLGKRVRSSFKSINTVATNRSL